MEVSVPTLCRGKDRSLVKCPGVQPDRYSIFVLDIYFLNFKIPEFTLTNFLKLLVLIFAMLMHYHFILARFKTANEEAVKVLESLPDPE